MKVKKIIFFLILLLILIYFGVKSFFLFYYKFNVEDYDKFIDGLNVSGTMIIKKETSSSYLTFNDVMVKDEFKDFKLLEIGDSTDNVKYVLYDSNNKLIASFWIGVADSYVSILSSDLSFYYSSDVRMSNINMSKFLDKNNITTDIDLFNYLVKNRNVKNNIFTSFKKMQENYTLKFMSYAILPSVDSITLIDGDYKGYMFNLSSSNFYNLREARIIHNNKNYIFTFLNSSEEYFKDDDINRILNSIVFSDNDIVMSLKNGSLSNSRATFILKNNTSDLYKYGNDYYIEVYKDGKWKNLELKKSLNFDDIAYDLKSNESVQININFEDIYGKLENGKYRVIKKVFKDSDIPIEEADIKKIDALFEIK